MTIVTWAALATVITGAASVGSLIAVAWQVRSISEQAKEAAHQAKESAEAIQASAHIAAHTAAIGIDRFLIENPRLRKRIYGRIYRSMRQSHLQQVDGTAEMLTDLFALVSAQQQHLDLGAEGWQRYIATLMATSPDMRRFWEKNKEWYLPIIDLDDPTFRLGKKANKCRAASMFRAFRCDLPGSGGRELGGLGRHL